MQKFHNVPIYNTQTDETIDSLIVLESNTIDISKITEALANDKLVLLRSFSFEKSTALFNQLVDHYGLRDSYDIQMQFVIQMMSDRTGIEDVAVTVNSRGPFEVIQPHSEGHSTSQLDLFGLFCKQNANSGGQNILSLINQSADYSKLVAKEKVITGQNLSQTDINELRSTHFDAKIVASDNRPTDKVLYETEKGKVVVRNNPIKPSKSIINNQDIYTYWDNVTVHDHAFHKHNYELLKALGILNENSSANYEDYMHIEEDSIWAPADTNSGDTAETAKLFDQHILHDMQPDDFLLFNNKAWTHAVNNWTPGEERDLFAMYS